MLSPLFFSNPFLSLDFSCWCGAVFNGAGNFNGDISTWEVGEVTNMYASTYNSSFPLPKIGPIFGCLFFPSSLFCAYITNSIFEQLSPLFFHPSLSFNFSLFCGGAVFFYAGDFNGDLSKWQVGQVTIMHQSTYTLSCGSFFFPSSFFCAGTNYSIFEQCSLLFFFQPIFILGLFFFSLLLCVCSVSRCCWLQW